MDFQICVRSAQSRSAFDELVIQAVVGWMLAPPRLAEFAHCNNPGVRPAFANRFKPLGQPRRCVRFHGFDKTQFPVHRNPAEPVSRQVFVEMNGCRRHDLFKSIVRLETLTVRFNRTDAQPAVESALKAEPASAEEIARPAVQINAVDEVFLSLSGAAYVRSAWIVRIADRAVAVAVVDSVLTPNGSLRDVNSFNLRQIPQIVGSEKSANEAFGAVAVADHVPDNLQSLVNVTVYLFAGRVHRGEIPAGNKRDFVAQRAVIFDRHFSQLDVVRTLVVQRQPRERPRNSRVGHACRYSVAKALHHLWRMERRLVMTYVPIPGAFNLIDADNAVYRYNSSVFERLNLLLVLRPRPNGKNEQKQKDQQKSGYGQIKTHNLSFGKTKSGIIGFVYGNIGAPPRQQSLL